METVIKLTVKSVYGIEKYYPANTQAQLLAKLADTKTLTPATIDIAKKMGFTIEQAYSPAIL